MADYIMMPKDDYKNACDAIRSRTGSSDLIVSGDMANEILIVSNKDIMDYVSGRVTSFDIPDVTPEIRSYCFYHMSNLTSIAIPDSVATIGTEAFRECPGLTSVTIPAGTTTVSYRAFSYCIALETVKFLGTPNAIRNDAFKGSNVYDIYVPWKEGQVSGAPWGAVDATIYYNSEVTA